MPEAHVRGVTLCYQIIGDGGDVIALTPGSRRSYDELVPIGRLFAAQGHRVLLHDRRNCGRSDIGIEPCGSEHEIWADDLAPLCQHVGAEQVYAEGASVSGNDRAHSPSAARRAASLIRHAEFHDNVVAKRSDNGLLEEWHPQEWKKVEGGWSRFSRLFSVTSARKRACRRRPNSPAR